MRHMPVAGAKLSLKSFLDNNLIEALPQIVLFLDSRSFDFTQDRFRGNDKSSWLSKNFLNHTALLFTPDGLSLKQHYRCVSLDAFDMLSPKFDFPQTRQEVEAALSSSEIVKIRRLKTDGLNLVGQKR